jgi:hypothetical protein
MRERRDLESLIAQLRTTREKLLAADPERTSDKDIKAVAAWRAHRRIPLTDTPENQTVYQSLLSRSAGWEPIRKENLSPRKDALEWRSD